MGTGRDDFGRGSKASLHAKAKKILTDLPVVGPTVVLTDWPMYYGIGHVVLYQEEHKCIVSIKQTALRLLKQIIHFLIVNLEAHN